MNLPTWIYAVYSTKDGVIRTPNAGYADENSAKEEAKKLNQTTDSVWLVKPIWIMENNHEQNT